MSVASLAKTWVWVDTNTKGTGFRQGCQICFILCFIQLISWLVQCDSRLFHALCWIMLVLKRNQYSEAMNIHGLHSSILVSCIQKWSVLPIAFGSTCLFPTFLARVVFICFSLWTLSSLSHRVQLLALYKRQSVTLWYLLPPISGWLNMIFIGNSSSEVCLLKVIGAFPDHPWFGVPFMLMDWGHKDA